MKKVIIFILLAVIVVSANAQNCRIEALARLQYGAPVSVDYLKPGIALGVRGEMDFNDSGRGLFADASLLMDIKKWDVNGYYWIPTSETADYKYNTYGIHIPVNVGYKFGVSKNVNLLIAFGPYLNYGIGGKQKVTYMTYNESGEPKSESSKEWNVYGDNVMNRLTVGLSGKFGVEVSKHYSVHLGFERGLTNSYKDSGSSKMGNIVIGAGYMF